MSETKPALTIDFVPEPNEETVKDQIAAWVKANAFMGLTDDMVSYLDQGHVSSITFGTDPGRALETTVSVDLRPWGAHRVAEDPEGTYWRRFPILIKVGLGYGSQHPPEVSRHRVQMLDAVTTLAERLQEHVAGTWIWSKISTRAGRAEAEANRLKAAQTQLVAGAVALECAGMRKGSERMGVVPEGVPNGTYHVERDKKSYTAYVTNPRRFNFVRTK